MQENESSQVNFGSRGGGKVWKEQHFHFPLLLLAVSRLVCSISFGRHWTVKPHADLGCWTSKPSCHIRSAHIHASQSMRHASFQAGFPFPSLSCLHCSAGKIFIKYRHFVSARLGSAKDPAWVIHGTSYTDGNPLAGTVTLMNPLPCQRPLLDS